MLDPNAKADFLGGVLSNVPTPASVFVSVMVVIGEACVLRLASVVDGSDVLCALVCFLPFVALALEWVRPGACEFVWGSWWGSALSVNRIL